MITSEQIRAARQLVRITAEQLAHRSGVGLATIRRYELATGVPPGSARALNSIKKALEEAGVEFIGTPEEGAGVRFALRQRKELL